MKHLFKEFEAVAQIFADKLDCNLPVLHGENASLTDEVYVGVIFLQFWALLTLQIKVLNEDSISRVILSGVEHQQLEVFPV